MKTVRLTDEAYGLLTGFTGRVQKLRKERVYYSEALLLAVRLADKHSDTEIMK